MKQSRILKQILASGLFMIVLHWAVGCANIVPPTGGPRDSIPPFLIAAKPKDSSVNIQPKEILVGFNEFVTAMDLQNNFIISPGIKTTPLIDARLNMLRIRLNDSLQKNTTYSLQFGNAIRDVNEGNIAKNFTYVFSTGNHIDTGVIKGRVQIAETGLIDSTLLVVLHPANNDTAIFKKAPLYYAKINGKGKFEFKFLPPVTFNIFVIPNDYTKRYDDSTKLFAFLDNPIQVGKQIDSTFLYVFQSAKKLEKKKTIAANSKKQIKVALQYNKFFEGNEQDILSPLKLGFDQPVKLNDSFPIQLCDTLNKELKNYTVKLDSTKKLLLVDYAWEEKSRLKLIIPAKSITDTLFHTIEKADTIAFKTKSDESYANAVIRLSGYQKKENPILLLTQDDKIKYSFPITNSLIRIPKLLPGDYVLKVLEDRNKNGIWDNGFYGKTKLQPEIVHILGNSVNLRTDFDNELNIVINP